MTMLIDELRSIAGWTGEPITHDTLQAAVAFNVDDVVRYLSLTVRRDKPLEFARALPNCAPLSDVMWFEWSYPFWINVGERAGVLLLVWRDLKDNTILDLAGAQQAAASDQWVVHGAPEETRWIILMQSAVSNADGLGISNQSAFLYIAGDGAFRGAHNGGFALNLDDEPVERNRHMVATYVALASTCFAHCKGVTITDHEQPRQQRRAAERAGRPPLVTYKTIDIAPVTRILRDEGQIEHNGIKKALHITRGHFAHYGEDAPLFGRYTGTFYRPMHVRGSLEKGLVVKDYRVHPVATAKDAGR